MKVSGSATIGHPVAEVFAALTDPAVLVRTLPGCRRLEQTGADRYQATLEAGVGSIKGLFDATVRLTDLAAPGSFTLHASGAGGPGTVDTVAQVRLEPDASAGGTVVHYSADATVGGVIAGVGQRMIAGVARRTAAEFFAAVDRALTEAPPPAAAPAAPSPAVPSPAGPLATAAGDPAPAGTPAPVVWTRPAPAPTDRQRIRELVLAATFGAGIALLGVLIGAAVAGW